MSEVHFEKLLPVLVNGGVEFVLVGGLAALIHGGARATFDVDVVYSRRGENLKRIAETLAPHKPYLRGAPPGLPFTLDVATLRNSLNLTLTTTLGDLDLLGEVPGGGTYESLEPGADWVEVYGVRFLCASLPDLLRLKRAAGRPKDMQDVADIERLIQERGAR